MKLFEDVYKSITKSDYNANNNWPLIIFKKINIMIDNLKRSSQHTRISVYDLFSLLDYLNFYYNRLTGNDLFKDTYDILYKKTMDYNAIKFAEGNFEIDDAREDYFPFGDESYVHMLYTKAYRIYNIASKDSSPNFEGIADSLIDCAAYLSFYYSYLLKTEKIKRP